MLRRHYGYYWVLVMGAYLTGRIGKLVFQALAGASCNVDFQLGLL